MIDQDARSLVEAARQRLKLFDISDAQIKKIEESEKPIRDLTIYSPYSGYVLQKNVNQGTRVMPGADLFDVADLSMVWITADIYEYEMPLIKVGDSAVVQLELLAGQAVRHKDRLHLPHPSRGDEDAQGPLHAPQRRGTAQAADVHQRGDEDRSRQKARGPRRRGHQYGGEAGRLRRQGRRQFRAEGGPDGCADGQLVEITAGLKAGEKVASSANFLIDSEAKLKGVEPLPRGRRRVRRKPPVTGERTACPYIIKVGRSDDSEDHRV